ncbi:class A beta-lactamase [Streptomyces sp. YS415]|uniref:class A beta-lactamase n=1 Tax=Streptomyces sp. YS415 TaxID=2944806 RepID=UPI002021FCC8|nr:class A beta-lactamase [Streptomyces sp. YS415]MCL7430337.1 class A beta-lactamase [Streptomyces sp. YS415]
MTSSKGLPTRRAVLAAGAAAAAAATIPLAGTSHAAPSDLDTRLTALEDRYGVRLGVYAENLASGRSAAYRADERFPVSSLYQPLAAATGLRDSGPINDFLVQRIRYSTADLVPGSPITSEAGNLASGMLVMDLCDGALRLGDRTAGNLVLRKVGGPSAVTAFCRSVGDSATRLDHYEPDLNSAEPGRIEDTTTARAIGVTYARLLVGDALHPSAQSWLGGWMVDNETDGERLRAGLPETWLLMSKTGESAYGTDHNVGVTLTQPGKQLLLLSVLTAKAQPDAVPDHRVIAEAARLLTAELA